MADSVLIAPSILSADMAHLADELDRVSGADLIHFDVMDGHFVQNLTFGPQIVRACKRSTSVPIDCHLMVENPDACIDWYVEAGADSVTVHYEASTHLHRTIQHLHELGVRAGVALNPATPVSAIEEILPYVDLVLIMSVNPGFGGQRFIESTYAKLARVTALCERSGMAPLIEVDGGITADNIAAVTSAGADVLVAGSAVFGSPEPRAAVEELRTLGNQGLLGRRA